MRRIVWLGVVIVLALAVGYLATGGIPPPMPNSPGTFSFGVLGDAPYFVWEDRKYWRVLQEINEHDLSWVVHVGDIFWRPCSDARYQRSLDEFNALRHPVIYTPGDNEWTDCWEPGSGRFAPLERLRRLREIFFADPTSSLGARRLALVSQGRRQPSSEFVENVRWSHEGLVFATVHLVGTRNATESFPGRAAADDEAVKRRTEAAAVWLRETFAEAKATNSTAVVLGFHANPGFEASPDRPYGMAYEPFLTVLEEEVELFARPVLAMQGNDHEYIVDRPLVRRTTGRRLEQFTRLQVPGSPEVGWVRIVVTPGAAAPFSFEPHVTPRWRYW